MAISKSTPYVRYKKDFTSSLHLGTIHIESEYLDRTQKTTIESIHGMTWHNKVVNENKELNLLSDTQLELTGLEKQYWNTGEKRVSVDEIHTLEEVEPNEDGTYTYTVNSMEGEYIEIYDGINNITSTSDGLDGQFEIVYDTTEEDINGNIALDSIVPQYEITDSGVGAITGAKSTGLTLVNNITESSKEEVVAIEQQEGQYFTIDNTVQGNIKSAILKGNSEVVVGKNKCNMEKIELGWIDGNTGVVNTDGEGVFLPVEVSGTITISNYIHSDVRYVYEYDVDGNYLGRTQVTTNTVTLILNKNTTLIRIGFYLGKISIVKSLELQVEQGEIATEYESYSQTLVSVKLPVLTTTGKNLIDETKLIDGYLVDNKPYELRIGQNNEMTSDYISVRPNTVYTFSVNIDTSLYENWTGLFYYKDVGEVSHLHSNRFTFQTSTRTITTPSDCKFIRISSRGLSQENAIVQFEEGTTVTSYEPFKSNILTANEPVELRAIGDTEDELNLMTGELTQRIGEIVLNGSESGWRVTSAGDGYVLNHADSKQNSGVIADTYPVVTGFGKGNGVFKGSISIAIVNSNCADLDSFKLWLSQNPITLKYQLATESVKTVDLTVQNQDGSTIPRIQTQQGITHVSTSSDGLTPVVEMSCSYDTIIKPNTTYTIKLDRPIVSDTMYLQVDLGGTMMMLDADVNAFTIKTPSTLSHSQLRLSGTGNTVKEIIVLEGNRVNDKIEYFEGMKNVENPILIVSNCPYVFGKGGRL